MKKETEVKALEKEVEKWIQQINDKDTEIKNLKRRLIECMSLGRTRIGYVKNEYLLFPYIEDVSFKHALELAVQAVEEYQKGGSNE